MALATRRKRTTGLLTNLKTAAPFALHEPLARRAVLQTLRLIAGGKVIVSLRIVRNQDHGP